MAFGEQEEGAAGDLAESIRRETVDGRRAHGRDGHDPGIAQDAQVLRDRRLGKRQLGEDLGAGALALAREHPDYADPRGVAQGLREFGDAVVIQHGGTPFIVNRR